MTVSLNRFLKIYWAFLITISLSCKMSWKPHLRKRAQLLSSLRLAAPKSTTSSFLDLISVTSKMFHIWYATFYYGEACTSCFILISFLMVTTACFWKLWLRDLRSSRSYLEDELGFLPSFRLKKCSSSLSTVFYFTYTSLCWEGSSYSK